jgi:mercuric ion transport protein
MNMLTRIADKTGALGSLVSAMGCAMCFPALASLGAAIGLGFLSRYEGVLVRTVLPLFAVLALLANALGGLSHRQWRRSALGVIGPVIVLAATLVFRGRAGAPPLLYVGLALMVAVSIRDLIAPAHRRCGPDGCDLPQMSAEKAERR